MPGSGSGSENTEALSVTSDPLLLVWAIAGALIIGIIVVFLTQADDFDARTRIRSRGSETMTELGRVAGPW